MIDRNYIEQLFKAHFVQMHRFAVMLLHDEELAADVVMYLLLCLKVRRIALYQEAIL